MNNNRDLLNSNLLAQPFEFSFAENQLEEGKYIAQLYSKLENCISILSDMKAKKSYIYYGTFAQELGFRQERAVIDSIWEDELLEMIHPEDLQRKYRIELQFFSFLKTVDTN